MANIHNKYKNMNIKSLKQLIEKYYFKVLVWKNQVNKWCSVERKSDCLMIK